MKRRQFIAAAAAMVACALPRMAATRQVPLPIIRKMVLSERETSALRQFPGNLAGCVNTVPLAGYQAGEVMLSSVGGTVEHGKFRGTVIFEKATSSPDWAPPANRLVDAILSRV